MSGSKEQRGFDDESRRQANRWIAGALSEATGMTAQASAMVADLKRKAISQAERAQAIHEDLGPLGKAQVAAGEPLAMEALREFLDELRLLAKDAPRGQVIKISSESVLRAAHPEEPAAFPVARKIKAWLAARAAGGSKPNSDKPSM